jgi:DNA repair protein RecN (Recombination protein N)
MLKSLNITNFAVIERLEVEFDEGLNLLTGETGSGKSIIVDSLSLLLGGRSNVSQIRTGERLAAIEGLFKVKDERQRLVRKILQEAEIECPLGEEIVIRREIITNGRSRILIEDQSATLSTLKALQPHLVEIHGQGEQRALLSTQSQMLLLDTYAGSTQLRKQTGEAYARWKQLTDDLRVLEQETQDRDRTRELLQFQLSEIELIAPRKGEDEELLAERKILTHGERVLELGASAYEQLYERDESILDRLGYVRRNLEELSHIDEHVSATLETLETGMMSLTDVADTLRHYGEGVEFSATRLAEVEQRLTDLDRLKRKYGKSLEEILKIRDEISEELENLGNLEERERLLLEQLIVSQNMYVELAKKLTDCRRKSAEKLAKRVMQDLQEVAMEQARFVVSVVTAEAIETIDNIITRDKKLPDGASDNTRGEGFFTPYGADRVEFQLSANPGESPRELSKVASGGELSRLMLTLRAIALDGRGTIDAGETIIFDEIDVGIGGRAAEAVGLRLKALSRSRQVLCVTHQPQIARFADQHYQVSKSILNGRTLTSIKRLSAEERVGELSRMIGGAEDAEKTREAARWLLEEANEKASRGSASVESRVKNPKYGVGTEEVSP